MKKLKVGLACNIKPDVNHLNGKHAEFYAECDSLDTINAVKSALESFGSEVEILDCTDSKSFMKHVASSNFDIIYNLAEGLIGESRESYVPSILEMLEIPYTASGVLCLAITLNKARAKEIMSFHGVKNARFFIWNGTSRIKVPRGMNFPFMVKPLYEGSSKGIRDDCVIKNFEELESKLKELFDFLKQPILIEEFLTGREFTVGVLGNEKPVVLPIVEIKYDDLPVNANKIYSFEAKWIWDRPEKPLDIFSCPAEIDEGLKEKIKKNALKAYRVLDCKDWSRIDVRLDQWDEPNIIEINPLPGILPDPKDNSCLPKAARAAGITYEELINAPLLFACKRYNIDFNGRFKELENKIFSIDY